MDIRSPQKLFRPGVVVRRNTRSSFDETLQALDDRRELRTNLLSSPGSSVHPLPPEDDTTNPFALEILYHRLSVSMTASGLPSCTYLDGSGISQYNAGDLPLDQTDIQNYMDDLQTGLPTVTCGLYNASSDAPNIMVRNPCYVIIELHTSLGLRFINGETNIPALQTQLDWAGRYCNLWQYDVEWNKSQTPSEITEDCYLLYFGVRSVVVGNNDRFNLNFQSGDDPDAIYITVDPAIKNRGPHRMAAAAAKKKKKVLRRAA